MYHLAAFDKTLPKADDVFTEANIPGIDLNTLGDNSNTLGDRKSNLGHKGQRDEYGRFISPSDFHRFPFVDNLDLLTPEALDLLYEIAEKPRAKKRIPKEEMESIILKLCEKQYVSNSVLAKVVKRSQDLLRKEYLSKMLKAQKLKLAFPTEVSSPKQAYIYIPDTHD